VRPVLVLLGIMAVVALLAGLIAYQVTPPGQDRRIVAAAGAHGASYACAFIGTLVLAWRTWRHRRADGSQGDRR
jgi:hypothetical protein